MVDRLAESGAIKAGQESTATVGTVSRLAGAGQIEAEIRRLVAEGFYTAKVAAYTVKGRLINAALDAISIFSPSSLFANGEVGAWYDPSDVDVNWRRNLLTYTEEFDNAYWSKAGTTVTANATTAPDGTLTGDLIIATSSTSDHIVSNSLAIGLVDANFSVYVKAGDYNYVAIGQTYGAGGGFYKSIINLATGEIESQQNSTEVTDVGNGWYRVSIQFLSTFSTARGVRVSPQPTSTYQSSYTGDDTSGIYIWGAQLEVGDTATAYQRIVTPEITYVADVQPLPILYQDSTGTTPVTAVEQPVGLMLDKSQNLELGPELVTNGTFDTDSDWTKGTGWSIGGGTANLDTSVSGAGVTTELSQTITTVSGQAYKITFNVSSTGIVANELRLTFGGQTVADLIGVTNATYIVFASGTSSSIAFRTLGGIDGNETITIDNVSVKEIAGNHAYQSTLLARPVLSARYNLLSYSEQFDNAAWSSSTITVGVNTTTAPDGTTTADTLTQSVVSNTPVQLVELITITAGVPYTLSCYIKNIDETDFIRLQLGSGNQGSGFGISVDPVDMSVDDSSAAGTGYTYISHSVTSVGDGWYHLSVTGSSSTTTAVAVYIAFRDVANNRNTNGGTGSIYIWGADLRAANDGVDLPVYQRVDDTGTTGNYDTVGFPVYLSFDGTDDSMVTNSIDFTGTDKMTVWSGARKLSDAAKGILVELSSHAGTNIGAFNLQAPEDTSNRFTFGSKGTEAALSGASTTDSAYVSPITTVLTGIGDISGDISKLRIDSNDIATSTIDQGIGNYGNFPLYIGRRGSNTFPYNGRIYELIVRGAESTETEITDTETWVNEKTKAFDAFELANSASFTWDSATASPAAA